MKKRKTLEELLHQDVAAIMRKGGVPEELIEEEPDKEGKTLANTLRRWAEIPDIQNCLKNMLVESIDTKVLSADVMIVTISLGSVLGLKAIKEASEKVRMDGGQTHGHA